MTRLNIDILTLVVDNVDDPGTLFSLLTVSKQVLRYVCRALYRDPGYFLRKMDRRHEASDRFVRMTLTFSTTTDDMIKDLQQAFDVKQATTPPMFDYFSFIRVVRYLMDTLITTVGGHRLGNITEIEIESTAIGCFISGVTELARLERIKIIPDSFWMRTEDLYTLAIKLVKAIYHHHGQGTQRECQIVESSSFIPSDETFLLILELGSLLPPLPALKTLSIEPSRPLDRYLATLKKLSIFDSFTRQWPRLSQHYDCDLIHILQCCRELTDLEIEYGLEPRHANLFAWAAQEERDRAAGKRMLPAVPLESLRLSTGRMKDFDAMKIVRDALFAFARSLCLLKVDLVKEGADGDDDDDGDGDDDDDGDDDGDDDNWSFFAGLADSDSSPALPNLTEIHIQVRNPYLFDPRLLLGSPKLDMLWLKLLGHCHSFNRVHSWPLASHPYLTCLNLEGVPTNAFDPRALANMPYLEELTLKQALEDPTPERSLRMERWTWDWHLPELKELHILCAMEGWFSVKILQTCRRLWNLTLESTCKPMLEIGAVLGDCCPLYDAEVQTLRIGKNWDITPTDLALLFNRAVYKIEHAELPKFDSCTLSQVVEATRDYSDPSRFEFHSSVFDKHELNEAGLVKYSRDRRSWRCVYHIAGVAYCWDDSQYGSECDGGE
ncbi:hypothetical protein DFQ26_000257 [Actinomortierella ambigua]|nr:hypothetical protein DFQ26_000257 [Actinomortierella ambigua]